MKVAAERARQRYTVKAAAEAAGVARDTWKRVEDGLGVNDVSRAKVLDFLGLDDRGDPGVSAPAQDQPHAGSDFLYSRPPGISDVEWERITARSASYIDGLIEGANLER